MKSMNKFLLLAPSKTSVLKTATRIPLTAVIVGLLVLTGSQSSGFAEESCAELVTNRCETCHYNTRICQKVKKDKGKGSWKRTVKNMVKQGAKVNKDEQKKLVTCLSNPAPDILELCGLNK